MTRSPYLILKKPVTTEKSFDAREKSRTLCFRVDPRATKAEIKRAVRTVFKVEVESVRTALFFGKRRQRGRMVGYAPDWKKAFVKLKAGEKVPELIDTA